MNLFSIRNNYNLSQKKAAEILGIPIRTYIRYEKDQNYGNDFKREMMAKILNEKCEISESNGILSLNDIKEKLVALFESKYVDTVNFCYLFGSYAKGYANKNSDVDLCVSTTLTGLKFAGLSEQIRLVLHKNVDLVNLVDLTGNIDLVNEIMKDGIKIYG